MEPYHIHSSVSGFFNLAYYFEDSFMLRHISSTVQIETNLFVLFMIGRYLVSLFGLTALL